MFYEGEGVLITVDEHEYHSYRDLDLILTNAVSIGTPKQQKSYIDVPGRNGKIDISSVLTGYITYESRPIEITFENVRIDREWDNIISNYRNMLDGKIIKIIFDNDKGYYWQGRCSIADFERNWNLGKFVLSIPEADPYKYDIDDSTEPWKWDPFSFVTGIIKPTIKDVTVDGTATYTIKHGLMPTTPNIIAVMGAGQELHVSDGVRTYDLVNGINRFPSIKINGPQDVTLTFTGHGKITLQYRGGSL